MRLVSRLGIASVGIGGIFLAVFFLNSLFDSGYEEAKVARSDRSKLSHGSGISGKRESSLADSSGRGFYFPPPVESMSCSSLNPFATSPAGKCKQSADPQTQTVAVELVSTSDPLLELPRVVDSIGRGSTDDGREYLYMRQFCADSTPVDAVPCKRIADVAEKFSKNLELNAERGDSNAQKILGLELIREVQSVRYSAQLAKIEASSSGDTDMQMQPQPLTAYAKWNSALDNLRQAAITDREAASLLQTFSAMQ
jgi:hypothetical protein